MNYTDFTHHARRQDVAPRNDEARAGGDFFPFSFFLLLASVVFVSMLNAKSQEVRAPKSNILDSWIL